MSIAEGSSFIKNSFSEIQRESIDWIVVRDFDIEIPRVISRTSNDGVVLISNQICCCVVRHAGFNTVVAGMVSRKVSSPNFGMWWFASLGLYLVFFCALIGFGESLSGPL